MYKSFAKWIARRLHAKQKLQQSLRWYQRWGIKKLTSKEQLDYAGILHDNGKSEQAIQVLGDLLTNEALPHAFERRAHIYNELGMEQEALADLDQAIKLDPEPYLYWYTRAITHHDRGEFELAVNDFKQALTRREDSKASTYYELGNVYMKMGKPEEAEKCYSEATIDPSKAIPHYYYRQAQALEQLNRLADAHNVLLVGIELQEKWARLSDRGASLLKERTNYSYTAVASFIKGIQDDHGFRLFESKLLEAMGELTLSLEVLEKAIADNPDAAELQLRKGTLLRELEHFPESIEVLKMVNEKNPLWLPAYMELCTSYRMNEMYQEAIQTLEAAKEHFPNHMVIRFWLADAYRDGSAPEKAFEENRVLIEMEPEDPLNWKQCAEIAIDRDQYVEADAAYGKAIKLEENADYYMRRSFSRYMTDRYEDAMMDIQAAVKLDEGLMKLSKTAYALGELYVGMENWTLADSEYSRALALEPENSLIYDRRARCRFAAERLTDALEDCNRGLHLDMTNARLIWLRGLIHYRLDDYNAALTDSLTYTSLLPQDSQGYYNLGLIYNHLNRHDDALASFTKVIELNPFEPPAYLERASLWYHHSFDRIRATDDLTQWLLYAGGEKSEEDRFALLNELRGFDDEMRERTKEQFVLQYGSTKYLS